VTDDPGGSQLRVGLWERLTGSTWAKVGEPETWTSASVDARAVQYGPGVWSVQQPWDEQAARFDRGQLATFDILRPEGPTFRAMTGLVEAFGPGEDERGGVQLEASGSGALALFRGVLTAPDPATMRTTAGAVTGQPVRYTSGPGPAEDLLRAVIVANRDRLGLGFDVPASTGRGRQDLRVQGKWKDLLSLLMRKAPSGGLGVDFGLVNTSGSRATLTLTFYVPADRTQRAQLARDTGSLKTWKQSQQAPTATRAVIGGAGKGTARLYHYLIDSGSENLWGWPQEQFVDAREADTVEGLTDAGNEALLSASAQTTWELDAVEAVGMRWGQHFQLGDTVMVRVVPPRQRPDGTFEPAVEATAPLGAAVVTAGGGPLSVRLVPGNPDNQSPLFRTARILQALCDELRGLQREEG
jgi:hypothetical protein